MNNNRFCTVAVFSKLTRVGKHWNLIGKHFLVDKKIIDNLNHRRLAIFLKDAGCFDITLLNIYTSFRY